MRIRANSVSSRPGKRGSIVHPALGRRHGINFEYVPVSLQPGELKGFVDQKLQAPSDPASRYAGISVAIPHKFDAARLAPISTDIVRVTNVANTLVFLEGSGAVSPTIYADNTDVFGLETALNKIVLDHSLKLSQKSVAVIGNGATAVSACFALSVLSGANVTAYVRKKSNALFGIQELDISDVVSMQADLIISCVPPEAYESGPLATQFFESLRNCGVVFDANVGPTLLVKQASSLGIPAYDGTLMYAAQAVKQFALYTRKTLAYEQEIDYVVGLLNGQ